MDDDFPLAKLPRETVIDVWLIELDRPLNLEVDLDSILSAEERDRAERFVFARDALRFRLCRALLRLGLAWYLQKSPRKIALTTGRRGKPCLAERSELYFNVTHSDGLGLIAFTTVGEVGIDIEAVRRHVEVLDIASTNFTRKETAIIVAARTQQEQARIFLKFWTRKEAVLKAAGCGILPGLDTVDVSQPSAGLVRLSGMSDEITDSCWLVQDLDQIDGFAGAVAAPPGDWTIRQWPIRYEDAAHRLVTRFPEAL
jgi:4'-phosphopantetheinyl transferase